jgi:hypothetical protein
MLSFFAFSERRRLKKAIVRNKHILKETEKLIPIESEIWDWKDIVHVVLFPTAGEPADVIEPAIQSIMDSNFPKDQVIVLLATEEREPEETRLPKVEYLTKKFEGVFKDFLVTTHIVADGEMKCKASNAGFAARELQKYLNAKGIDYTKVVFPKFSNICGAPKSARGPDSPESLDECACGLMRKCTHLRINTAALCASVRGGLFITYAPPVQAGRSKISA